MESAPTLQTVRVKVRPGCRNHQQAYPGQVSILRLPYIARALQLQGTGLNFVA